MSVKQIKWRFNYKNEEIDESLINKLNILKISLLTYISGNVRCNYVGELKKRL